MRGFIVIGAMNQMPCISIKGHNFFDIDIKLDSREKGPHRLKDLRASLSDMLDGLGTNFTFGGINPECPKHLATQDTVD
ncbi:MAG: hypothetical protein RSB35_02430, partial [Eubacterium sp.]